VIISFRRVNWDSLSGCEVPEDCVHLWATRLDAWGDLNPSRSERERADSFVFERDQRRFIVSHAILRHVLAAYVGIGPDAISYEYGPHGKPALASGRDSSGVQFNLSHSEELGVIALAKRPVGVDIELISEESDFEAIAEQFLTIHERQALGKLPQTDRRAKLPFCWTRKEALLKGIGAGFFLPMNSFAINATSEGPLQTICPPLDGCPEDSTWTLVDFQPAESFVGSVAIPFEPLTIQGFFLEGRRVTTDQKNST
jgi:4'-phosphopantetheinyl transferase